MMAQFKAVIWDMDGVLVETGQYHYEAWQEVLKDYDIPFSIDTFRETFGMNNRGLLEKLLGTPPTQLQLDLIANKKELLFRNLIHGKVELEPGVRNWLETFHKNGILQAIGSSAPQANIDLLLDEMNVCNYFLAVISGENMPGKPDPAIFLTAAKKIQVRPEDCVVIEDAITGITAAKKAGMKSVAITSTNSEDKLSSADRIIDSFVNFSPNILNDLF